MPTQRRRSGRVIGVGLAAALVALPGSASAAVLAGGGAAPAIEEALPAEFYRRVEAETAANVARLTALGLLPAGRAPQATLFAWPLETPELGYFSPYGIANFVDHNPSANLLDYHCGQRTYDGHRGIDIFLWPYGWLAVTTGRVEVHAAAAGTIVARDDGHFDRNCVALTDDPNYVILQHADGGRSWYLHMKQGSVTAKQVGDPVAAGEYLGRAASSGYSTGPHLHFEVHGAGADPGPLLDPFAGTCNLFNAASLWLTQLPYRDPTINYLSTHDAPPVFPDCPGDETPNARRLFAPGETIYFLVFLHDEGPADTKFFEIRRPDGTLFDSWSHAAPATYDASYWYWSEPLPAADADGRWLYRVTMDGVTRERAFWVGALFADDFEDANLDAWSAETP